MDGTALFWASLPFALMVALTVVLFAMKVYGAVLGFRKKWYFGLMALTIPFFAEIVVIAKLIFKKDILEG